MVGALAAGGHPPPTADLGSFDPGPFRAVGEQDRIGLLHRTRMVARTPGSYPFKTGSTKMSQPTMKCAGIDTSKLKLDVALADQSAIFTVSNDKAGHKALVDRFREHEVTRVGIEATGNYEAGVVKALRAAGVEVVMFDPRQIHGYRTFRKQKAKTDPIDARLIATVTAALEEIPAAPDHRMAEFAEILTMIEQMRDDVARYKTRRDRFTIKQCKENLEKDIKRLKKRRDKLIAQLRLRLAAHPDLARKLELLESVPGIGSYTAMTILVRMPEIGSLTREQAAALVGVAPINRDTGQSSPERHISGGRTRLRQTLFMAALPASYRWNTLLVAFYKKLISAGKSHKVAIIACVRKLINYANTVIRRGTPWQADCPPKAV